MLDDKVIEFFMSQVLQGISETNKKLGQIKMLLMSPPAAAGAKDGLLSALSGLGGDLSPDELIKKAAAELEEREKKAEDVKKAEATHVEHNCPACGHAHAWDLHPYTEPGDKFVEFVRSEEEREKEPLEDEPVHLTPVTIQAFVESQLCDKCRTPMTAYIDSNRAEKPVISVAEMYGIQAANNPPKTVAAKKKAAAGAVDPTLTPTTRTPEPKAGPKKAAPKKKRASRKKKKKK